MIDYVSEEDTCRSAYLLEYFGQADSADCGTCDICRSHSAKVVDGQDSLSDALVRFIDEDMAGEYTLDDIKNRFSSPECCTPSEVFESLRDLIDRGIVPRCRS